MKTHPFGVWPRVAWSGLVMGLIGISVWLGSGLRGQETPPELAPEARDKNVMRFKLYYAQAALEAITVENFPMLATNAQKLSTVTREVSWRIRHSPEYERLTADFRRHAEALAKAASNRNVDAATVAYFQMTVSCVTCHKYLRGRDVVLSP